MLNDRENTRIINYDSIVLLLIIFFGLLIFNGNVSSSTETKSKPVSVYTTIGQNSAVSSPGIRLQVFQKTWILNKDNFNLLAFNRNPLYENKRNGIKISYLLNVRQNRSDIPEFIFLYHLFPAESAEIPLLS